MAEIPGWVKGLAASLFIVTGTSCSVPLNPEQTRVHQEAGLPPVVKVLINNELMEKWRMAKSTEGYSSILITVLYGANSYRVKQGISAPVRINPLGGTGIESELHYEDGEIFFAGTLDVGDETWGFSGGTSLTLFRSQGKDLVDFTDPLTGSHYKWNDKAYVTPTK